MEGRGRVLRARVVGRAGLTAGGDAGCGGDAAGGGDGAGGGSGGLGGGVVAGSVGLSRAEADSGSRAEGGGGGGSGRSGLSGAGGGKGGRGAARGAPPFRRSRVSLVSAWLQRDDTLGGGTDSSGILKSGQMSGMDALPPA